MDKSKMKKALNITLGVVIVASLFTFSYFFNQIAIASLFTGIVIDVVLKNIKK